MSAPPSSLRPSMRGLPLRAAYSIAELSRASGIERRKLTRLLDRAGVQWLRSGRVRLVSLSELELKLRPLWEGILAAEMLRAGGERE